MQLQRIISRYLSSISIPAVGKVYQRVPRFPVFTDGLSKIFNILIVGENLFSGLVKLGKEQEPFCCCVFDIY